IAGHRSGIDGLGVVIGRREAVADMTIGIGLEEIADFDPGVAAVIPPEAAELEGLAIERLNLVDAHADPDAARSDLAWRQVYIAGIGEVFLIVPEDFHLAGGIIG